MKNGRPRKYHQRRDKAPAVICLPPPKPPVTAPRHEPEIARALSFPVLEEPLVTKKQKKQKKSYSPRSESRQLRDKAGCTNMKARPDDADPGKAASSDTLAPLPKSRSLTLTRPGMLHQLGSWLRGLVVVKKPVAGAAPASISVSQINALRRQVASMQKTLDRMAEISRA